VPLSDTTIALVKATIPALEQHGIAITHRMYERMFRNEEIRDLFNQSHHGETGSQPKALAGAVLAYARNIDNLAVLGAAVERIAQKHAGLLIRPEHYPHVAEALLGAIGDVLGEAATPEILAAWREAYWALADILIGREAQIYCAVATAPGGWEGWRRFVVAEKVRESDLITSFHLRPEDGGRVLRHRPRPVPDLPAVTARAYAAEAQLQHFLGAGGCRLPDQREAGRAGGGLQLAA
jgi:nitric oxide dioxygenase